MWKPSSRLLPAAGAVLLALLAPRGALAQEAAPAPEAVAAAMAEAAAPGAVAVPAAAPEPPGEFRYNPAGRRDPFKSLLQLEAKKRDVSLLPPIQQFDLASASVVGIVVDPVRGAQAMIRAPNGKSFVLRKGTIVGKNDGEVVEITLEGIRVVERFVDFMSRETRKETFLQSRSKAGN